jgi:hypothetical protein
MQKLSFTVHVSKEGFKAKVCTFEPGALLTTSAIWAM